MCYHYNNGMGDRPTTKKRRLSKFWKRLLVFKVFLISFLAVLFFVFVINNPKQSVFPQLHIYQPSPKDYVRKKGEILTISLPEPEVVDHGPRDSNKIALTFDADMTYGMINMLKNKSVTSWYNKDVIDYLKLEKTKATIFMTGLWVATYPEEANEIANNPLFEIGNHSYSHPAFTKYCFGLPFIDKTDEDEVDLAQKEIIKVTHVIPMYFRFPGGCYNNIDVTTISRLGMTIVHWDVVGGDGFNQNEQSIISSVESQVKNGSIIVLHLNGGPYAPKTHKALYKIIPELKSRRYEFVKISELLNPYP